MPSTFVTSRRFSILRSAKQPLLIIAAWLMSIAIATAGYSTISTRRWFEEMIAFGCSFGIAVAISPVLPLFLGSRRRWAIELTLTIISFISLLATIIYALLWVVPWLTLQVISLRYVLAIRERTKNVVAELGTSWAPIAGIVGVSIGVIAGVLTLLARWKPRLAVGVAIALMLFVASGVANQWIFGAGADFVLDWRQRQHKWRSIPRISDLEIASAVGGTAGGFAGVTTAGLVLWNSRNKRRRAMQA